MEESKVNAIEQRISALNRQITLWKFVLDAYQELAVSRELMVLRLDWPTRRPGPYLSREYIATHRWEINPDNGCLYVQLGNGGQFPVRLGDWCPWSVAVDFFEIERSAITIDPATKEMQANPHPLPS